MQEALSIRGIFLKAFKLYKEEIKAYFGISLLCYLPILVTLIFMTLLGFISIVILPFFVKHHRINLLQEHYQYIFCGLLMLAACYIITGAIIKKASEQILGRKCNIKESLLFSFRNIGKLFVVTILSNIFLIIGGITFLLPGIYISILFCVVMQIVLIEERKGIGAILKRSMQLVKGNWWRCFSVFYLNIVLAYSIIFITSFVFNDLFNFSDSIVNIFEMMIFGFGLPYGFIVITVLYYDLIARNERNSTCLK